MQIYSLAEEAPAQTLSFLSSFIRDFLRDDDTHNKHYEEESHSDFSFIHHAHEQSTGIRRRRRDTRQFDQIGFLLIGNFQGQRNQSDSCSVLLKFYRALVLKTNSIAIDYESSCTACMQCNISPPNQLTIPNCRRP
jgi:hypothetical protein